MPRRATNIPAARLWARLDRFECECPACGRIITPFARKIVRGMQGLTPNQQTYEERKRKRKHKATRYDMARWAILWDVRTQLLRCQYCRRVYVGGLLLYPVPKCGHQRAPEDTVPDAHQRAELRSYGQGWYAEKMSRDGDPVNVYVEYTCTCPPPPGWMATCPIHGAHRPQIEGAKAPTGE
jgi:hypothetical protein